MGARMEQDVKFVFDSEKNNKLKIERGIGFEDIIEAIYDGKILDIIPHYNHHKYSHQNVILVEIDNYVLFGSLYKQR